MAMPPTSAPGCITQYSTFGRCATWRDRSARNRMFIDPPTPILPLNGSPAGSATSALPPSAPTKQRRRGAARRPAADDQHIRRDSHGQSPPNRCGHNDHPARHLPSCCGDVVRAADRHGRGPAGRGFGQGAATARSAARSRSAARNPRSANRSGAFRRAAKSQSPPAAAPNTCASGASRSPTTAALQAVWQQNRVSLGVGQPETAAQPMCQLVVQPHCDRAQRGKAAPGGVKPVAPRGRVAGRGLQAGQGSAVRCPHFCPINPCRFHGR